MSNFSSNNATISLNKYIGEELAPLIEADTGIDVGCLAMLYEDDEYTVYPQIRITHVAPGLFDYESNDYYNVVVIETSVNDSNTFLGQQIIDSLMRRLGLTSKIAPPAQVPVTRKDWEAFFIDQKLATPTLTEPVKIDTMRLLLNSSDGWFKVKESDEEVRRHVMTFHLYYYLA